MVNCLRLLIVVLMSTLAVPCIAAEPQINLSLNKDRAWQREQVLVTLEVTSDDTLSRLEAESFEQSGFSIIPFELQKIENDNSIRLILKWAVFPYIAGEHAIQLPRVRYRPNRGRPKELKLSPLFLKVRSLPIYVPPTMPVGKVTLKSHWGNGLIISSKKLFEWQISATSEQVSPQTLPTINPQLVSTARTQILPVQRNIKTVENDDGITHQQQYQIPIKALKMGALALPEITVQYFDPELARLNKVSINSPFSVVINPWLLWLIALCLLTILGLIAIKIAPKVKGFYSSRKLKQQALISLNQASTYQQIRESLSQIAKAENKSGNFTLEQFAAQYESKHPAFSSINKQLDKLNANNFSASANQTEIQAISKTLYKLLR